ncbi:unnamed protein product, partial [Oncorhynchus mykiss]
MELYRDQAAHLEKIAYQQRLLQEDVVHIRAEISSASTEMARAWEDYSRLESSVEQLRAVLEAHMNHSATPQVRDGTAPQCCAVLLFHSMGTMSTGVDVNRTLS